MAASREAADATYASYLALAEEWQEATNSYLVELEKLCVNWPWELVRYRKQSKALEKDWLNVRVKYQEALVGYRDSVRDYFNLQDSNDDVSEGIS